MYVYIKSEPSLWTVGFYAPDGAWHSDRDFSGPEEAAARVHYLNGGSHARQAIEPEDTRWLCLIWDNGMNAATLSEKGGKLVPPRINPLGELDRVYFDRVKIGNHYIPAAWSGDVCTVPVCMVPNWRDLPVYGEEK